MDKKIIDKLKELYSVYEVARKYGHAVGVVGFDFETIVPEDSKEAESELLSFLMNEEFKLVSSDKVKNLIIDLHNHIDEIECPLDKRFIELRYEDYLKTKNITPEFNLKMNQIYSKAYIDWHNAKNKSDFSLFKDSLKKVIEISKEAIELRDNKLPILYDNMLNDCEKGMLTKELDIFFKELKEGLIDLLNKIKNSKHVIRDDFLNRKVSIQKQKEFSNYLLNLNGYDFKRGCIAETEHPFTSNVAKDDSRVTTHYYEDMVLSNIYSVIHEGGHAIFMQNEPNEDYDKFINDEISNGMHESVSRFFENVIGRSKEYIHLIYPKFIETFDEFKDISEEELYEAINIVKPSLIRTEADEVTYGLHIVIRYEMERLITEGKININDVPKTWNKLYKDYLGIDVLSDKDGVLQDVHWSSGFGYFPSYAMGNAYNAMYVKKLNSEFSLSEAILAGDFKKINNWLKNNVFIHANRLDPKDWIKELTGKELTAKDFLEYLNEKYSKIYRF